MKSQIEIFKTIINTSLSNQVRLENIKKMDSLKYVAGVDVAYWGGAGMDSGICCIIVIDFETKAVVEKTYSTGKITIPYAPGYLAFRELPLVIKAAKKLSKTPDLFMFDGNGYLHPTTYGHRNARFLLF